MNKDVAVLDKAPGTADARIKIDNIHWYVFLYTLSFPQQGFWSEKVLSETSTELRYIERSVFMKVVNKQNLWNFELGSPENMNVLIWLIVGVQQNDRQDSQNITKDTFCRLPVTSAQFIIATENYPDGSILKIYDDDVFLQGYCIE